MWRALKRERKCIWSLSTTNAAEPLTRIRMRDALERRRKEICDTSHVTDLISPDSASTVCFCTFMGCMQACELHAC